MITRTDRNASPRPAPPCPCGCAPGGEAYCKLEGPLRPRFFCGQLLTDEDLTTMVDWTAGKFRLQRFRDGWGVACGLDVRCDPDNPQGVIVGAGYTVSCCGDDIVVGTDQKLDLSAALRDEDPCADPDAVIVAANAGTEGAQGQREAPGSAMQVRWADVFVAYAEQDTDPRATLRHSDCVQAPECEAAKTRESFELRWQLGGSADPAAAAAETWCRDYRRCLDVLCCFVDECGSGSDDWADQRTWLLRWIERHPPQVFCDLRDLICTLPDDELAKLHLEILTKLVVDYRSAYTRTPCHTCERATGVRLARVYLGPAAENTPARVLHIDNHLPFRRRLSRPQLPAPVGTTNLGSLIGARWDEACQQLADLGVHAKPHLIKLATDAVGLREQFARDCDPLVACGRQVVVLVTQFSDDRPAGERVVGFCETTHSNSGRPQGGRVTPDEADDAARDQETTEQEAQPTADQERRNTEKERLKEANGIGDVLAERLVDEGLTLETIAATPEAQRHDLVTRVKNLLPPMFKARAPQLVDDLRRIGAAHNARLGGQR